MSVFSWSIEHATFLSFLVALVAFFRPEITSHFQRRRALVDFHPRPSHHLIIGLRGAPLMWLDGTIESVNSNSLISDIDLTIIRNRDKSTHTLKWVLWESTTSGDSRATPAYAFNLLQNVTVSGIFAFRDVATEETYQIDLVELRFLFIEFLRETFPDQNISNHATEENFLLFQKSPRGTKASSVLDQVRRSNYWEQGHYHGKMRIKSRRPDKTYGFSFYFSIEREGQQSLSFNEFKMVMEGAGVAGLFFNQVHVKLGGFKKDESASSDEE